MSKTFPSQDFDQAVVESLTDSPFVTSTDVATRVGCSRELARQYLVDQHNSGSLQRQKVGGGAVVYYPAWADGVAPTQTDDTFEVAPTQNHGTDSGQDDDVAPAQTNDIASAQPDETVLFFPSRREVVVDTPTDTTQRVLSQTAHLVDATDDGYLYKISEADIWNAPYDTFDALCDDLKQILDDRWDGGFESRIRDDWERAHQFTLRTRTTDGSTFTVLDANDPDVFENIAKRKLQHHDHYTKFISDTELRVKRGAEAAVKEVLYDEGYPVTDAHRLDAGDPLDIELTDDITLRDYQQDWVDQFESRKAGVFVGPSGSGKTIAALGAMVALGGETLILVPNRELAQQWETELREKTTLTAYDIGQYHGGEKNIRPVTIATYDTAAMSRHRKLFNEQSWGLVIADECHHAVASTWKRFRTIQSTARLGLSATPVRESGSAKEIYTLIGPPVGTDWGTLFADGWVAQPDVEMVLVPWGSDRERTQYQRADGSQRLIHAAKNSEKATAVAELLDQHPESKTIIFVDWIEQGEALADALDLSFIHGETPHSERNRLYEQFRAGDVTELIISRVGDEGIDLPDAEVAILASTLGSSRSQTGQRAGRTMRPFGDAHVYLLLTKGSGEEDWGRESTQYLAEKGIDITKRSYPLS